MEISNAINVEEALGRVVNNKALFKRLLGKFSGRKLVEQIEEAINAEDYTTATNACHALKGLAANLAMYPLTDITKQIEKRLANNESAQDLFPVLYENLEAAEAAIEIIIAE